MALPAITPQNLVNGTVKANYSPSARVTPSKPATQKVASKSQPVKNAAAANTTSTPATTSSSSSSTQSNTDPVAASYYGGVVGSLNSLIGALGTQQDRGVANINNSANASLDAANKSESNALSKIATQRQSANTNKVASLNSIDDNVANTVDSFKRLLAQGHAGNSAFGKEFVPMATAKQGTTQRTNVFNTYGQDMAGLDSSEKDAKQQYDQNVQGINAKRNSDILDFISGLQSQGDSLRQQAAQAAFYQQEAQGGNGSSMAAAMAPFQSDTASRVAALNALFDKYANPTYSVTPVSVTVPDISNYTQDPLTAQLAAENPDTSLAYLPYLQQIKKNNGTASAVATA